jgi:hypothetical protein
MSKDALEIAKLNDAWRTNGPMMITSGVQAFWAEFVDQAIHAVRTYSDFNPDNDPYGERDFGSFELEGQTLFWKIDYYAKPARGEEPYQFGSEDPSNPAKTDRVTTVMLAEEY